MRLRPSRGKVLRALAVLLLLLVAIAVGVQVRLSRGIARAEREFAAERPSPPGDFGATSSLTLLPLVDFHASRPDLRTEPGVSYLVRTDGNAVLFDVGFNQAGTDPSPLAHNLRALGLSLDAIDTIFISHLHPDHVGGMRWFRAASMSLGNTQVPLGERRVFVPVPMTYPGLTPTISHAPTVIGTGMASIGAIPRQLLMGRVEEQALAVRVAGRGLVLIVGCGHQTLSRILSRTRALFPDPIYGVIGGLHYPVPEGRGRYLGVDVQRRLASGDGPLAPITQADVDADIEALRRLSPGLVAVGGHDSSDEVIEQFRRAFGAAYRDVRVGEPIVITATTGPGGGGR